MREWYPAITTTSCRQSLMVKFNLTETDLTSLSHSILNNALLSGWCPNTEIIKSVLFLLSSVEEIRSVEKRVIVFYEKKAGPLVLYELRSLPFSTCPLLPFNFRKYLLCSGV